MCSNEFAGKQEICGKKLNFVEKTILWQKSGNGGVYKNSEKKKTFLQNRKIPKNSVFF